MPANLNIKYIFAIRKNTSCFLLLNRMKSQFDTNSTNYLIGVEARILGPDLDW